MCLGLCAASLRCAGQRGAVSHASVNATIAPPDSPAPAGAPAQAPTSLRGVRADLLDCELVEPLAFDETLSDGRMVESPGGRGFAAVRLHLRLQSFADRQLLLWACYGNVWIVPDSGFGPLCGPDITPLATLEPGDNLLILPDSQEARPA